MLEIAAGRPFFIENPHSGKLKNRGLLDEIPMQVVDYCKYGKPYRKRTAIWTNTGWTPAKPLCKYDCPATVEGCKRHSAHAQQGGEATVLTETTV